MRQECSRQRQPQERRFGERGVWAGVQAFCAMDLCQSSEAQGIFLSIMFLNE